MKVHLSRWLCLDVETNLERLGQEAHDAAASGAELVVFPELFLTGYRREVSPARARDAFDAVSSAAPGCLFVFGTISEDGRNRLTVWQGGGEVARYDKVHLFHPNDEHRMWEPGDRYAALRCGDRTIGLMTCNDVRFPEAARALRLEAGCEVLVVPAWWPWRRDHIWRTLLQARAIENAVWVLGCAVAGSAHAEEDFAGAGNHVFDPVGEPVLTSDDRSYELDLANPPPILVDPLEHPPGIDRVVVFEGGPSS